MTLESRCNEVSVCSPTLHYYTGLLDSVTPFELHFAVTLAWSHSLDLQVYFGFPGLSFGNLWGVGGMFLFCFFFHLLLVILYNHDQMWPQPHCGWSRQYCGWSQSWPVPLCGQFKTSRERGEKVKVIQLCPTLCDPLVYTVHGILQSGILEWVAFPFSRGSS